MLTIFRGKYFFFKETKITQKIPAQNSKPWLLGVSLSHQNIYFPTRIFALQLCVFPLKKGIKNSNKPNN